MTTHVRMVHTCNVIDNNSVSDVFSSWNNVHLKARKFHFIGSYDKQNLTDMII